MVVKNMVNEDDGVLYNLGVDLNSNMGFTDGDLQLASYQDNLIQSVVNRLNTDINEMDLFYEDYGSVLKGFLGWKANIETISFMNAEIKNVLQNDPRILSNTCNVEYSGDGLVKIDLTLTVSGDVDITANLVLTETGVIELETDELEIGEEI